MSETILVTGASAGFGQAICRRLVADGYRVIGSARRIDKLQALQEELGEAFYPLQMDVTDLSQVDLVNNAGLALGLAPAYEAEIADWLTMIQTNIVGLTYLTRKILPQMVERNDGYIINLGSTAGTVPYPGANVYGASKAFVKQFSLNLRADLAGKKIRVSNIEPGLCEGDEKRVEALYRDAHAIQPEDIANTVAWLIQQPKHVNVNRIEIMPVSQTFGPQPVYRD